MNSKTLSLKTSHLVLMANVKDAAFKCSSCKKIFVSEMHLRRHEERRHNLKTNSPVFPSENKDNGVENKSSNEYTVKDVLNATERIEQLLVKLALKDTFDLPLGSSSFHNEMSNNFVNGSDDGNYENKYADNIEMANKFVFNNTSVNTNIEKLDLSNEKSESNIMPKKMYYDFIGEEEKGSLWKPVSPSTKNDGCPSQVLYPTVNISNKQDSQITETSSTSSFDGPVEDVLNETSSINTTSRFREDTIEKLNKRLNLYGIRSSQDGISDKEYTRIGQLMKEERKQIAQKNPEYYKLRDLIKHNMDTRIKESIQKRSLIEM